jgi:hypothetical protein
MSRARDLGSLINSTAAGKNLIINGGFDIWQRGTTVSAAGSQYLADRWNTYRGAYAAGITVSRQLVSDSTNLPNLTYCIRIQRDSGNTATNALGLAYNAESIDSKLLAGKTVTASFYARAGATFISSGAQLTSAIITGTGEDQVIRNGFTNLTFAVNRSITLTSNWVRYSVTANLGATITQVALALDGAVSGTAGATDYFEITGVQLEVGSSATPFSRAGGNIAGELAKCQRYFYNVNYQDSTRGIYNTVGNGFAQNSTNAYVVVKFPVMMRVGPTLNPFVGPFVIDDGALAYAVSNISLNQSGSSSCLINCTTTGMTQYRPVIVYANGSSSSRLSFSAEL